MFTVEIRKNCKICGKPLPKRFRTYCSKTCRYKFFNKKNHQYNVEWGRKNRAKYSSDKKRCLLCDGWYIQVATHVEQRHHLTSKEYRKMFDLPMKKEIVPKWYHEQKRELFFNDPTTDNLLIKGKKTRYQKGDKRAKQVSGWKGRNKPAPDTDYF